MAWEIRKKGDPNTSKPARFELQHGILDKLSHSTYHYCKLPRQKGFFGGNIKLDPGDIYTCEECHAEHVWEEKVRYDD